MGYLSEGLQAGEKARVTATTPHSRSDNDFIDACCIAADLPARQRVLLLQDVRRELVRRHTRQALRAGSTSAAAAKQGAVAG